MKKIIIFIVSIVSIICLYINVFADESVNKIIINGVNIETNVINAYFDTEDSSGTYNNKDINKDNITATLGNKKLTLKSIDRFDKFNEGTAYVLMADVSKSMGTSGRDNSKKLFTDMVKKVSDKDKIAFLTFGNSEKVVQDFISDKATLIDKINALKTNEDNTDLYRSLTKGLNMLTNKTNLPTKRAIILISDGQESNDKGITKDEVLVRLSQNHIPVFSVAFKSSDNNSIKESLKILGSFARLSNGQDFILGDGSKTSDDITQNIINRINKGFVASFDISNVKMDGQSSNLNLNIKLEDNTSMIVNENVILPVVADTVKQTSPVTKTTTHKTIPFYNNKYILSGIALVFVLLVVLIVIFIKKRKNNFVNSNKLEENEVNENIVEPVFLHEGDGNMDAGKTVGMNTLTNMDNSIGKTIPLAQQTMPNSNRGVKILLVKIGKNDNDSSHELTLTSSIIIGRDSAKAKLVFKNDELLSGRHCELSLKEDMIFICDLNSTNGTYVNGVPISGSFRLHNDDIILLGSMELRIGFNEEN